MRLFLILLLAFTTLFFSTCKKTEQKIEATYPAFFEFTEEGAEVTTMGLIKANHTDGELIVQNSQYFPSAVRSKTVLNVLDVKNNVGEDIIKKTVVVHNRLGNYNKTGNISFPSNNIFFSGVSAFAKPSLSETFFSVYKSTWLGNGPTPSVWQKIENDIELSRLVKVNDGYLLIGAKINGSDKNAVVIKYNTVLNIKIWEKEFGGAGDDMAMDAVQLCDNNYGILAYTYSKGAGDRDVWFLKIDANGYLKWDQTYGGAGYEEPQKIVSRTGCDIYIAGHSSSFGAPEHDGYILRINENGDKIWEKTFGTPNHDGFNAVTHIPNTKTFIAVGRSMQGMGQPEDIFVVSFDEKGKELWRKKYGDPNLTELPQDIVADNEFYYLACNRVDAAGKYSAVFIKDKLGN